MTRQLLKVMCWLMLTFSIAAQMPRDSFLIFGYDPFRGPGDALFVAANGTMTFGHWYLYGAATTSTAVAMEDGEVLYFAVPSSTSPFSPGTYGFYRGTVGPNLALQLMLLGTYANPTNSLIMARDMVKSCG